MEEKILREDMPNLQHQVEALKSIGKLLEGDLNLTSTKISNGNQDFNMHI